MELKGLHTHVLQGRITAADLDSLKKDERALEEKACFGPDYDLSAPKDEKHPGAAQLWDTKVDAIMGQSERRTGWTKVPSYLDVPDRERPRLFRMGGGRYNLQTAICEPPVSMSPSEARERAL